LKGAGKVFTMSEKTFEQSIQELENTVKELENGDCTLQESVALFEKGVKLTHSCMKELDEAQQKIAKLVKDKDGKMKALEMEEADGE